MKVFCYGTLKRGYGNNSLITKTGGVYLNDLILPNYALYNFGFPAACPEPGGKISGEVFEINEHTTLPQLDRLEGEGYMYNRVYEKDYDVSLYVGSPVCFNFDCAKKCPIINGSYVWSR